MTKFYMLIGVPAAGKSFWLSNQLFADDVVVISTDALIDSYAASVGKTYDDVFWDNIGNAQKNADAAAREAFAANQSVVWDQVNAGKKIRAKRLRMVPSHYEKIAVFFTTPEKIEHERRLTSRPGKTIPPHVIIQMISNITFPSKDEGFNQIIIVKK